MNIKYRVTIAFFALVLLFPQFLNIVVFDDLSVVKIPKEWKGLGNYIDVLNTHFDTNKPLKKEVVLANSYIDYFVFNEVANEIYLGKDGWLFYNQSRSFENLKGKRVYNEDTINQIAQKLNLVNEWAIKNDIKFVVQIGPNRESVYPEKLGNRYDQDYSNYDIQRFASKIFEKTPLNLVNPISQFRESDIKEKLYYKRDSHWTNLGGFISYIDVLNEINGQNETLQSTNTDYVEIVRKSSDLSNISRTHEIFGDDRDYIIQGYKDYLEVEDLVYPEGKNSPQPYSIGKSNANDRSILLVGDSFLTTNLQFYLKDFGTVTTVHRGIFKKAHYEESQPDVIVFSSVERSFEMAMKQELDRFMDELGISE